MKFATMFQFRVVPAVAMAAALMSGAVAADVSEGFDAAATYRQSCFACHNSGAAGAPKVGDAAAWAARLEKGFDAVVATAIKGVNAMPPKGMCFTCTDDDVRAVVQYMVDNSK